MTNIEKKTLSKLHKQSSDHKDVLDAGLAELVGCFYCRATFPPGEIDEYIPEYSAEGTVKGRTALCPRCCVDSVIPVKLAENALETLNAFYFRSEPVEMTPDEAERLAYLSTLLFGDEDGNPVLKPGNGNVH